MRITWQTREEIEELKEVLMFLDDFNGGESLKKEIKRVIEADAFFLKVKHDYSVTFPNSTRYLQFQEETIRKVAESLSIPKDLIAKDEQEESET